MGIFNSHSNQGCDTPTMLSAIPKNDPNTCYEVYYTLPLKYRCSLDSFGLDIGYLNKTYVADFTGPKECPA